MVIFRENTEDIYAGIEYAAGTPGGARRSSISSQRNFPKDFKKIRFGTESRADSSRASAHQSRVVEPAPARERLVRAAIDYAITATSARA